MLGEATKVALLRKRVPLTYGVPALVVDNLIYNLSVVFFVLSGAVVMLLRYPLPPGVYLVLLAIAAIAASGILVAAIAAKRRVMLLTWIIDRLGQLRLSPKVILKKTPSHLPSRVESLRLLQASSGRFLSDDCVQPAGARGQCC